jgi:hypothetical protein
LRGRFDGASAGQVGSILAIFSIEDAKMSHVIFRDADSRMSAREAAAVEEWIGSGKPFHLMRDHPFHWPSIMAGMWGCKGGALTGWQTNYQSAIAQQAAMQAYGGDQAFLADVVYPQIKTHCLIHDSVGLSEAELDIRAFPTQRHALEFVGQSFDEQDNPNTYYEQELATYCEHHRP